MQSQLAAALLGHGNVTANAAEDDFKDEPDEEGDDVDEFIDEEYDAESGSRSCKTGANTNTSTGRTITLQMLLSADILQPGEGSMTIEYLGQKFVGDLMPDGKIKSQETDIVFASPSAWAIHCKRIINPDKKSGCGWASVKYRGKKLDAYKSVWFKKKKEDEEKELQYKAEEPSDNEMETEIADSKLMAAPPAPVHKIVVKHNTIANRTFTHDSNTLIECIPFSNLGKIQPFLVSMSTNAVLLMDFHCHLTTSEVSGYLAGQWDVNGHNLSITHAFPCRNTKADHDHAAYVEAEIAHTIEQQQLTLVGWYHSHPTSPAAPTLRDIDAQLDYQIKMKGSSDSSYTPCVGVICSPYNQDHNSLESAIISYWIIPPPENKPNEYGRPMLMSYSVVQDNVLPSWIMEDMKKCVEYYKKEKTFVNFANKYQGNMTYLEKFKTTLSSKFPRDQNDGVLWGFIKEIIGYIGEDHTENNSLLAVPSVSMKIPTSLPPLSTSSALTSNLMLTSNIASVLFQSGKFPSATSLLGLPDPMAQSTLAANNMFLSPSLFKMQDTLNMFKPMSSGTPIPSTSKSEKHKKHENKVPILDFGTDLSALKNKMEFSIPDLGLPKTSYSSDLALSGLRKMDYLASDLSISSVKTPKVSESYSVQSSEGVTPPKIPKTDFGMLDLSFSAPKNDLSENQMDLSISLASDNSANTEQPLNLSE